MPLNFGAKCTYSLEKLLSWLLIVTGFGWFWSQHSVVECCQLEASPTYNTHNAHIQCRKFSGVHMTLTLAAGVDFKIPAHKHCDSCTCSVVHANPVSICICYELWKVLFTRVYMKPSLENLSVVDWQRVQEVVCAPDWHSCWPRGVLTSTRSSLRARLTFVLTSSCIDEYKK